MFGIAALSIVAFSVIVTVNLDPFTYTGTTAVFYGLNFVPACFLIYIKHQWNDINIKLFFHKLSKDMHEKKFDQTNPQLNNEDEQQKLTTITSDSITEVKKNFQVLFKKQICFSGIFYLIVSICYSITIGLFEVDETKGAGIANAIFLLFTDIVILSLPEKPEMLEVGTSLIYSPGF